MKLQLPFLPLFILFMENEIQAQAYIPMDTITDWKVESASFGGSWEYWYTYTGDTIINNQSYRIIEYEIDENFFIELYFREERASRKVYLFDTDDNEEILYYDFSLEVGEDFYVDFSETYFRVADIDTVLSEVGPLRRWWFESGSLQFTYIEAVGGHPLNYQHWIYVADPTHYTSCAYHYCEKIYGDKSCLPPSYRTVTASQEINICEGEDYMGISVPGIYVDTLITTNGCDSILTTTLNLWPLVVLTIDTSICEGDTYNGPFSYVLQNEFGCDTTVIINVNVEPLFNSMEFYSLCPGEEVYGISEEGIYTLILPSLSTCDTVLILNIFELPEDDPACITAISNVDHTNFSVYPNPALQSFIVACPEEVFDIIIYDLNGMQVFAQGDNPGIIEINSKDLPMGVYIIQLKTRDILINKKIIIQR